MIGKGLFLLTLLSNCVLSLPVTSSQLENADIEVMKCIVEALAEVLSKPHPVPVSQECLSTLKSDDRLIGLLRHHNFLRELKEIAVQGDQERIKLRERADGSTPPVEAHQTSDDSADRSMLEAFGGPGERSILSQRKRTENEDGRKEKEEKKDAESQEDAKEEVERGRDEEKKEAEEREDHEKKRADSEEEEEEKNSVEKKDEGIDEGSDDSRNKSKQKKSEEEKSKRASFFSQKHTSKEQEEEKRGSRENADEWSKRAELLHVKKKALVKEARQLASQYEVPHHSKEDTMDEMGEKQEEEMKRGVQKSPEEKELQMIARWTPEERRAMEEEGSASRKSEEPEIESLAAIESELETVAQKLHELRRG